MTAFRVILVLFFLWGFLTCLNDILVPHFRELFDLSYFRAVLIPTTFFTTCFVFAPIASLLIDWLGYRQTIVAGLLTMGAGALFFLPATHAAQFAYFLVAIGVIGAGITILQTAAAPYVASLGPPETRPSRFSLALAFASLGTMAAPLFGGWFILRAPIETARSVELSSPNVAVRLQLMNEALGPYLFIGLTLLLLAAVVAFSGLPRMRVMPEPYAAARPITNVFQHKPLIFGAIAAFLYAGAEIGIGSLLVNYLSLPEILNVSHHHAAFLASVYWGGAVTGRIFGWRLLRLWRVEAILFVVGTAAAVLVAISVLCHGVTAGAAILAIGLCNALIVPIVVMLAISGLGPLTSRASSVMVAANIGAGLIPLSLGLLADRIGVHHALAATIFCYGGVVFYAAYGSRGHLLPRVHADVQSPA